MFRALWILLKKSFKASPKLKNYLSSLVGGVKNASDFLNKVRKLNPAQLDRLIKKLRNSGRWNLITKKLQNSLMRNPRKMVEQIERAPRDIKQEIQRLVNDSQEGVEIVLNSSWIVWGVYEYNLPKSQYKTLAGKNGSLTLKLATRSNNNPSGIYTFFNVPDFVFHLMTIAIGAGSVFWDFYYGKYSLASGRILTWKGPTGNYSYR